MALTDKEREEWKARIDWKKVMRIAPGDTLTFGDAPDNVRDDDDLARYAIEKHPDNFTYCSVRLRDDNDFARAAVEKDLDNFGYCSDRLCDDTDFARFAVDKSAYNFKKCSDRLCDDTDFARFVIEKDPSNFKFCSERIHHYDDLARFAIEKDPNNFKFCSDRLSDDTDLARCAVEKDPSIFYHCSERIRHDDDLARRAVEKDPLNFRYCSGRLRDDTDLARLAIEKKSINFYNCSERLQADPLMQAYKTLVEAEENNEHPDLSECPKPIQDAWNIQTPFLCSGENNAESRQVFVILARGAMDAEARRQQSPTNQALDTAPGGIDDEDMLPELAAFDADHYADHPAHALKPPSDDDGPDHDLHRGPR